jgi:serine/threonine protein kinase
MKLKESTPSIEVIFFAALELDGPDARSSFLDKVCGDPATRERVERLLAQDAQASGFLESPAPLPTAITPPDNSSTFETPGTIIGPYTLLKPIGEGGMGVVYMAEQAKPVRRKVALKIIKPGMDTKQVIARFEAERQALAILDHPNIAKVFDAGATEGGRPYFVMELIDGISITAYCDREELSIGDRIEMFIQLCQAVQHAHQKGIIHRDIKPSNVLITLHDGNPVPKVIDFGVAKAIGSAAGGLTDKTLQTGFAQLIGTPLYMSPEQAELGGVDVDTRSDIYSLGVLLYELLTGTTPFDQETFRTAPFDEIRRIIREQEPPRPSTRLRNDEGGRLKDDSKPNTRSVWQRYSPLSSFILHPSSFQELDWIVMKCLEKDRARRYETASSLAADIRRYLDDEPVEACPPSASYRLRKFARRNRAVLTTTVLVTMALVAGTTVSVWQAIVARRAQVVALAKSNLASRQQQRAETHLRQAREAVDQMLTEVGNKTLRSLPQMEPVRRALLEKALKFYERFLVQEGDDPAIRLEAGRTYRRVGTIREDLHEFDAAHEAYGQSIKLLDQLATTRPLDLECRRELASTHSHRAYLQAMTGKMEEAEREMGIVIELRKEILRRSSGYADDRYALADEQGILANLLQGSGRLAEARSLLRSVCDSFARLVGDFPANPVYQSRFGAMLNDQAAIAIYQGKPAEALPLLERAIPLQQAALKADPQNSEYQEFARNHQENLAVALTSLGKKSEAAELYRKNIRAGRELVSRSPFFPERRHELARTYENLAMLLNDMGPDHRLESGQMSDQAAKLFGALAAEYPAVPGYRLDLAYHCSNRGERLRTAGRWKDAEQSFRRALELDLALVTAEPGNAAYKQAQAEHYGNLAQLLAFYTDTTVYNPSQAARLAEAGIKLMPQSAFPWNALGVARYREGHWDEAITALEKAAKLRADDNAVDQFFLAMAYWNKGNKQGARHCYDQAVARMEQKEPNDPDLLRFRAETQARLGVSDTRPPAGERRPKTN